MSHSSSLLPDDGGQVSGLPLNAKGLGELAQCSPLKRHSSLRAGKGIAKERVGAGRVIIMIVTYLLLKFISDTIIILKCNRTLNGLLHLNAGGLIIIIISSFHLLNTTMCQAQC